MTKSKRQHLDLVSRVPRHVDRRWRGRDVSPGRLLAPSGWLVAGIGLLYTGRLLRLSRRRAEQYLSLSWGVLAGLMRSLDGRDQHAARHAAAVARLARDIAERAGMSAEDQELAHTAGLLHDIGRVSLPGAPPGRGGALTDEDWRLIQRHPELGADLLKDLALYGPVAEIVLAHHERIDGRGYPNGLSGDGIPAIARIIAVGEVYDRLTASDTYRTPVSRFEALDELRRVSGAQLDGRYVELLADLLTRDELDRSPAAAADFDIEVDTARARQKRSTQGERRTGSHRAGHRHEHASLECSFCGKTTGQVEHVIAGPGVAICNECVQLVVERLAELAEKHAPPPDKPAAD
jgi:putative nucleotidyltransferase with HDIG domain